MESLLIDRVSKAPGSIISTFIPIHDYSVFGALMLHTIRRIIDGGDTRPLIYADGVSLAILRQNAGDVLGEARLVSAITSDSGPGLQPADRVFLCFSEHGVLSMLGTEIPSEDGGRLSGGWSVRQQNALAMVSQLESIGGLAHGASEEAAAVPPCPEPETSALAMALMAAHATAQAERQENITRDKDDLFSVLSILKAISSKRRAHDILFVFVEQISKVVKSDRCSIVRIWGGDPHGHVMASHEDASVVDKSIELFKYPELHHAMSTQKKIVVNDACSSTGNEPFTEELRRASINSLVVLPIVLFDQHVGSLLLRAARIEGNFTAREISFFEIVAEAASNALERAQLFESIQVANERLERLAITDGLTGLYNHRHFREHLEQEFDRASRYKLPLSCLIFDVDDFKKLNDTFGHLSGDSVLKEIAARTMRCVRKSDLIARYGGEEFVVIMPQTGREGAQVEAQRICDLISGTPFSDVAPDKQVTISGGVSVLEHETMLNAEDLLRAADQALYEAKRNGKNQVVVAPVKGES